MRFLLFLLLITPSLAFIAYECGEGGANYTAISLLDVKECSLETEVVEESEVNLQLLQPREISEMHAYACKIVVNYVVAYCGMHSHSSIVKGGVVSKIIPLNKNDCMFIHKTGSFFVFGKRFNLIRANSTTTSSVTFAGEVGANGACTGGFFSDGGNSWGNVIAEGSISFEISDFTAVLRYDRKEVRLPSGTVCDMDATECIDQDAGYTFWDLFPREDCQPDSFHVLYRGNAKRAKVYDRRNPKAITYIYTVSTGGTLFTLSSPSTRSFCFLALRNTDHPKLLIHEVVDGNYFFRQQSTPTLDLDMFMYVNTKFLHLEKTMTSTMKRMYQEIMQQKCELERTTLLTQLSLAVNSPMEFAYSYTKSAGYTATVLGEVVYLVKCDPVEVRAVENSECIKEMPVSHKNRTRYMLPRSRILQDSATPVSCSTILKPQYRIGGSWYYSINSLHSSSAPKTLGPNEIPKWTQYDVGAIGTAGVYSDKQLEDLRMQIMAPLERKSKTERIAGILNYERVSSEHLNLASLMDPNAIKEEIESFWNKCWNSLWFFGTVSSGVIGIMIIFRLIKFCFDTVVHGLAIYEIYGCTWHIMGSIWDAMTTLLLHRAKAPTKRGESRSAVGGAKSSGNTDVELGEIPRRGEYSMIYPVLDVQPAKHVAVPSSTFEEG